MKRLIAAVKSIHLRKVLAIFFAGFLVFLTTACSGAQAKGSMNAMGDRQSNSPEQGIPGHRSERYEGGMNGFSDVDPRMKNTGSVSAKAKGLVDNAERNVIDQSQDIGTNTKRILDKKGENVKHLGQNAKEDSQSFGRRVERTADQLDDVTSGRGNFSRGAERAGNAIQDNTRGVARGAERATSNMKDNTASAGRNIVDNVKQAADSVQSLAD